jgi:hypothetical protein
LSIKDSNESHDSLKRSNQFKDMNTFEIVKKLTMMPVCDLKDLEVLLNDDPCMISFLMYENIPEELIGNFDLKKIIDAYVRINNNFITSCLMEEYIFKFSDWSIYNYINLIRIFGVILELKALERKKTQKDIKYRFSQVLSKISHKNMMNKKMKNNNFDIEERLFFTDKIIKENTDAKLRKKNMPTFNTDEMNYINTYEKYFELKI